MKQFTNDDVEMWASWIGQNVNKRSRKPFKNGEKISTVKLMTQWPHLYSSMPKSTGHWYFVFEDHNGPVECFRCQLYQP